MNFADIQVRLGLGVLRTDLAPYYGDYVNEALFEIQKRRSWTIMKATEKITVGPGNGYETATLLPHFKELRPQPAINFITDDGFMMPAEVVYEEQEIERVFRWGGAPIMIWPPRVFFQVTPTGARIGLIMPAIEAYNFSVNCYNYLPPLVNPTDTSLFIDHYPKMVLAKSKAIALSEINDPQWQACEQEFEKKLMEAIRQDAHSEVAGRRLHM